MGLERPDEEGVGAEQGAPPGLAVAAPELVALADAPQRAPPEPPQDRPQRRIEPDDEVGLPEDQIPKLAAVMPVDDPSGLRESGLDTRAELVCRRLLPVRAPVQSIELDVRNLVVLGQPLRDCRLARARRSDDGDLR
jgi:hypothetical protein